MKMAVDAFGVLWISVLVAGLVVMSLAGARRFRDRVGTIGRPVERTRVGPHYPSGDVANLRRNQQTDDLSVLGLMNGQLKGTAPHLDTGNRSRSREAVPSAVDPLVRLRIWHEVHQERRRLRSSAVLVARSGPPSVCDFETIRLRRPKNGQESQTVRRSPAVSPIRDAPVQSLVRPTPTPKATETVRPVVRVLGPISVTGLESPLTAQQTSLVTLLAVRGPQAKGRLIDSLWNGQVVSDSRFANLITELRGVLGKERLQLQDDRRYHLVDVAYDHAQFADLARTVEGAGSPTKTAAATLTEALMLVRGRLLEHGGSKYWHWLDDEYPLMLEVTRSVVSASIQLAATALNSFDSDTARWACRQGLLAVPDDEQLLELIGGLYGERER